MCRLTRSRGVRREHRAPRWPRRALRGLRRGDDRGAVAMLVAVLLGGGVLLGMGALVIDVGRLYAEREELQSGADAAAWAVVEGCVRKPETCTGQLDDAQEYANLNSKDQVSQVAEFCGRGNGLTACTDPGPVTRSTCLGSAPVDNAGAPVNYAEVRTRTLLPGGGTLLPPTFAGALTGEYDGTEVAACARVAWGPPRRATGLSMTFSVCEFNDLTDGGTSFWSEPDEELLPHSAEKAIYLHSPVTTTCEAGPSGWDRPGGFGWLDDPDGSCATTVQADGTYGGNTGNSVSKPCKTVLPDLVTRQEGTLIPIYDGVLGTGSNTSYHLAGFASFVITGYHLGSSSSASWLTGGHKCSGSQRCLYGYFTRGLVPNSGSEIGGPDLGVSTLNLVG